MFSPLQPQNTVQVWDDVALTYNPHAELGPDYLAFFRTMVAFVGAPKGRRFCEVGCGSGRLSALLAAEGAHVTLVDIAPQPLEFAVQQDALRMGFEDEAFDVVWNGGVVEHFYDDGKIALLQEMWRVVSPGGHLFVQAPNRANIPYVIYKTWSQWRGTWKYGFTDDVTAGRLRAIALQAGIGAPQVCAYNPIAGWWWLRYGKRITQSLGLNTVEWHSIRTRIGNAVCLHATKPEDIPQV